MKPKNDDGGRRTPRQARSRATVDAIVLAAAQILRDQGEAAVTTARVAQRAGVSVGSLYQYFADREALLAELRERHGRWLADATRHGIERDGELPLRVQVRRTLERMVELHGSGDPLRDAAAAPLSPEQRKAFRAQTETFLRAHADALRPNDPALVSALITRAAEALIYDMSRDEPEWLRHPDFIDEVTRLVLGYLAPQASSEGA